jgi:outer membrane protein assembly factor BamB
VVLLAGVLIGTLHFPGSVEAENWPGWRGPQANGMCREKDVPKRWDIAWRDNKGAPYIPSFMVVDGFLFSVNATGVAFCYEAATGKVLWQERLGRHHASPVLVEGLIYFINDDGRIHVIRPGATFDLVAKYELGEQCYASPAISDGQVFLRGFKHLFCLGQRAP